MEKVFTDHIETFHVMSRQGKSHLQTRLACQAEQPKGLSHVSKSDIS